MQVLSWERKRKKLLQSLAEIDSSVAKRAQSVAAAWVESANAIAEQAQPQAPTIPVDFDYPEIITAEDAIFQPRPPEQPDVPPEADIPPDLDLPDDEALITAPEPAAMPKQKSLASYLD